MTRFFSWGPYTELAQPEAYIASLAAKRERGELLDFLVCHHEDGPIGVTGLSELSARDRRATVGSWFGHRWWGSGANLESKALIAALAFEHLGMERLTAWANTRNGRSQVRSGARRVQARGRAARPGTATATRSTTSSSSEWFARGGYVLAFTGYQSPSRGRHLRPSV